MAKTSVASEFPINECEQGRKRSPCLDAGSEQMETHLSSPSRIEADSPEQTLEQPKQKPDLIVGEDHIVAADPMNALVEEAKGSHQARQASFEHEHTFASEVKEPSDDEEAKFSSTHVHPRVVRGGVFSRQRSAERPILHQDRRKSAESVASSQSPRHPTGQSVNPHGIALVHEHQRKRKRPSTDTDSRSENNRASAADKSNKKSKTMNLLPQDEFPIQRPAKSSRIDLSGPEKFWENANAVDAMNPELLVQSGKGGRAAALAGLSANAPVDTDKTTSRDHNRLNAAMRSFVGVKGVQKHNRSVKASGGGWLIKGMRTPLKSHQIISCGFMREREIDGEKLKGGIIADQMGLGKTLTCLGNMVNGRPRVKTAQELRSKPHTTLIVVPPGLLGQWHSEIEAHTERETEGKNWGLGSVLEYKHSADKNMKPDDFGLYDVVLVSYGDCRQSWLNPKHRDKHIQDERGPLHRYNFLRVVLDEGHAIANPNTQQAKACFDLKAEFKWVLTGTPMVNGAKDLYSLLYFIGHPTIENMDFKSFKSHYCNGTDPMSLDSLSQEMTASLIGFTLKDKLFNSRLVTLPKPRNIPVTLWQTKLEAEIYDIVRARFQENAKTCTDNHARAHIWAMYTLLRQMTAHPLLVPTKVINYLQLADYDRLKKAIENEGSLGDTGTSMIQALKSNIHAQRTQIEVRIANNWQQSPDKSFDEMYEMGEGTDELEQLNEPKNGRGKNLPVDNSEQVKCCVCRRPAKHPQMTSCYHLYCETHFEDLFYASSSTKSLKATCAKEGCEKNLTPDSIIDLADDGKPRWLDADGNVIPSTKTVAAKLQITKWLDQDRNGGDPTAKIIVFCQWISFLEMLSSICKAEKWSYLTLRGSMSSTLRRATIAKFQSEPDVRVLICTLKTGGQGLNLTCARFVLNCDPHWNSATETQAFSRVYRIGQDKETEFVNLTLANTIDEHMNRIKSRKQAEIDQVNKIHKELSTEDLSRTFEAIESDGSDTLLAEDLDKKTLT